MFLRRFETFIHIPLSFELSVWVDCHICLITFSKLCRLDMKKQNLFLHFIRNHFTRSKALKVLFEVGKNEMSLVRRKGINRTGFRRTENGKSHCIHIVKILSKETRKRMRNEEARMNNPKTQELIPLMQGDFHKHIPRIHACGT